MSEISAAQEGIQQGIDFFQHSTVASEEASVKIGDAQNALRLASGGLLQVVEDIQRAEKLFKEIAGSYGAMTSDAENGAKAFKDVAKSESRPAMGSLIQRAEDIAKTNGVLHGCALAMYGESLPALSGRLEDERRRLEKRMADWSTKQATRDEYSNQIVPHVIVRPAEQWRDSL